MKAINLELTEDELEDLLHDSRDDVVFNLPEVTVTIKKGDF